MWTYSVAASFIRFRRALLIGVLGFVSIALLYSLVSLDSSFAAYSRAKLPKLPKLSGWLGGQGTAIRGKLNEQESLAARKQLGQNLNVIFAEYGPSFEAVNKSFIDRWPTMSPFELDKKFNKKQVIKASENFFVDDAAYDEFKTQQQAMVERVPSWESVSKAFSGRGVVICAGSKDLARVWPNVVLMLRSLKSSLPIQVWTKDQMEYDLTAPMVDQMRDELKIAISVHTLTDYMPIVWKLFPLSEVFKVKALALLFSSFEDIVLFDSDSIPVVDPEILFDSEAGKSGLIQWPDFWTNSVSTVMHDTYDIDYNMTRTCESGQLMISKKTQFEPLVMATYFNWWGPGFFYTLMYLDSMGAGDKDTFWIGTAVYHRDYHVVKRNLELIPAKKPDGSPWKDQDNIFNGAMAQFNPLNNSEIFSMHLHAPKVNLYGDELRGQYDLQFFRPRKEQNAAFAMGEAWLETHLWEGIQWIECDSILRDQTVDVCDGVKKRVAALKAASTP